MGRKRWRTGSRKNIGRKSRKRGRRERWRRWSHLFFRFSVQNIICRRSGRRNKIGEKIRKMARRERKRRRKRRKKISTKSKKRG